MSGPSGATERESRIEENLTQLTGILLAGGMAAFNFLEFANAENRSELMNLYYVAMAAEATAAVEELHEISEAAEEKKEKKREEFIRVISGGEPELIDEVLTKMSETLEKLKTLNIRLDIGKTKEVFEDLMDFEEVSLDELDITNTNSQRESADKASIKDSMNFKDFLKGLSDLGVQVDPVEQSAKPGKPGDKIMNRSTKQKEDLPRVL